MDTGWLCLRSLAFQAHQLSFISREANLAVTWTEPWLTLHADFLRSLVAGQSVLAGKQYKTSCKGLDLIWNPSESLQNIPLISVGFGRGPSQTRHVLKYITVISIQESKTGFWGKTSSWRGKWEPGPPAIACASMSAMLAKEGQWSQLSCCGLLGTFGLLPTCLEIFNCTEQPGSSYSYQFADILPPVALFSLTPHYCEQGCEVQQAAHQKSGSPGFPPAKQGKEKLFNSALWSSR